MDVKTKNYIIECIQQHRGDDLFRAKMAFGNLSEKELQEEYGQSGQTRQEIIDGYQKREDRCNAAIDAIESL